ncbi:hypothetical protein [Amycolatopsis sp. cmx-4-68]|uniref:hypothetical protein n=1 Tax=Amycolatopsis sp. cmx-4-68 TaxID=2790938 RepID=UPI0039793370
MKLLGTSLLLLTVTACAARDAGAPTAGRTGPETPTTSASPSPTPTSSPTGTTAPAPPPPSQTVGRPTQGIAPGDDVVAETQVDARGLPEGYPRSLVRSLDGRTLTLQAEEGSCRRISARVGDQTAQQVVVLVTVTSAPKGQLCPDYIREIKLPLVLAAPLGTRTVVLRQG